MVGFRSIDFADVPMSTATTGSPTGPCILIVDDDANVRDFLAQLISDAGYATVTAANGRDALEAMRTDRPRIVLLDLQMPVMDGWEFRKHQLQDPAIAGVTVIAVTGHHDPGLVTEQLGVRCVSKPIQFSELLGELQQACERPSG